MTRKKIWAKLLPSKMPVEKLNFIKLAKYRFTGGQIKNCILLAARKALANNKNKVTMDHFIDACESVEEAMKDFASVRPQRVETR